MTRILVFKRVSGQKEPTTAKSRRDRHRREDQLSHLNMDESPASPLPGGSTSEPPTEDLPPDTKKFLTFAGSSHSLLLLPTRSFLRFLHTRVTITDAIILYWPRFKFYRDPQDRAQPNPATVSDSTQ